MKFNKEHLNNLFVIIIELIVVFLTLFILTLLL
jgi:hypothetical protein